MAGRFEAEVQAQDRCEDCGTELPDDLFGKSGWECKCHRYTVTAMDYREYGHRRSDEEKREWVAMLKRAERRHAKIDAGDYRGPFGSLGTYRHMRRGPAR